MATISEKDFDKLVSHTIRIDMSDGTILIYSVTPEEKGYLINFLRNVSNATEKERSGTRLIMFEAYPKRLVFVNTAYMLRLMFCFDHLMLNQKNTGITLRYWKRMKRRKTI